MMNMSNLNTSNQPMNMRDQRSLLGWFSKRQLSQIYLNTMRRSIETLYISFTNKGRHKKREIHSVRMQRFHANRAHLLYLDQFILVKYFASNCDFVRLILDTQKTRVIERKGERLHLFVMSASQFRRVLCHKLIAGVLKKWLNVAHHPKPSGRSFWS